MARRNLWRSLATASLVLVSTAAAGLAALPASAEQANVWTVTVRDDGFSVQNLTVQKDDVLIFQLDPNAVQAHVLTWVEGGLSWDFRRRPWAKYGGPFGATGVVLHFYDSGEISGYDAASPFSGTLTISDTPPTTTTTTVRPPVTTTTAPRATTTTTAPPTTTTTDGAIHPLLVSDPGATTTTWAPVPLKVTSSGGPAASPPSTTTAVKDKTKAKDGPATTTTTAPPAPPAGLFDVSTLTPAAPTPDPSPAAVTDLGNSADVQSALAGILHPDKPSDSGASWLLLACGGFAALVLLGGGWAWFHRSSRYFPA